MSIVDASKSIVRFFLFTLGRGFTWFSWGRVAVYYAQLSIHLSSIGWMRSAAEDMPVDQNGAPIPWYTYAFLEFLKKKVKPGMAVFEWGSGHSTLWWGNRVKALVSCEHDPVWHAKTSPRVPKNVTYLLKSLADGSYVKAIAKQNKRFDIIVIDGRDRVQCALECVAALKDDGVIIWDNSERPRYRKGYQFLKEQGFKRLDFISMGPVDRSAWMTTLFYRKDNCFDI